MNKMRTVFFVLIALLLSCALLTGCDGGNTPAETAAETASETTGSDPFQTDPPEEGQPRIAVLASDPGKISFLSPLTEALGTLGEVGTFKYTEAPKEVFDPVLTPMIVIPDGTAISAANLKKITEYETGGGRLLVLGGPLCKTVNGQDRKEPVSSPGLNDQNYFYQIRNGKTLTPYAGQVILSAREYTLPKSVYSTNYRMESTGIGKKRAFRFIPLLEAKDEKGLHSGYAAWMHVYANGGMLSVFPMSAEFFDENGIGAVSEAAAYMMRGIFLTEAGTKQTVYKTDAVSSVSAKAYVRTGTDLTLRFEYMQDGKVLKSEDKAVTGDPSRTRSGSLDFAFSEGRPDAVSVSVIKDGAAIDRIVQKILCYEPVPEEERSYVTLSGNAFRRNGEPLHLLGVNYFGCYGGVVPSNSFCSNAVFDPYLVDCDMKRIKEIGFNAIAVQISPWADAQETLNGENCNMLYVLEAARREGLYVDIYLPFEDNIANASKLLSELRIAEFDNVVALDLFWEGAIGTYASLGDSKSKRDAEWIAWVKKNYGSVEAAAASFGTDCPMTADFDKLLASSRTGEKAKLASAFRRFMDDKITLRWGSSVERLKRYDPHHLMSFRCCDAGLPCAVNDKNYYYDFSGFCGALDFCSPEGYGFTSYQYNAPAVEGAFAEVYARLVCGDTATVWKEFGWSCWSGSNYTPLKDNMNYNAKVYEKVYQALLEGQGSGSFAWWYAGGLRPGEQSDFGVIDPDGSDRAATKVVREYAEKLHSIVPIDVSAADVVFEVDRDLDSSGLAGIYRSIKDEFNAAISAGKTVALVSAGKSLSVKEASKIALDGSKSQNGPRKYLNCVMKFALDGKGKEVRPGGKVSTETFTLYIANNGYTDWKAGDVKLVTEDGKELASLPELKQGQTCTVEIPCGEAMTVCADACGVRFGGTFAVKK